MYGAAQRAQQSHMPCASKSARGATPLALLTSARPEHATCVCANETRSIVVLIFLQVVSLLELDLRELGKLAAAQLHHLVPQRLGQAWSGLGLGLGLG